MSDDKSQLYSIFNSSELQLENDSNELYSNLDKNIERSTSFHNNDKSDHKPHHLTIGYLLKLLGKLGILGIMGILYHELSLEIKTYNSITSRPLEIGVLISQLIYKDISKYTVYSIEGILFGLILPGIDLISGNNKFQKEIDISSIVRSLVALLGISFAIRNIEWNYSLQPVTLWCLLNPILWYLLDSSISGFLTASTIASIASLSFIYWDYNVVYNIVETSDFKSILLLLGNFFFFGLVVFGKVGRYLFN